MCVHSSVNQGSQAGKKGKKVMNSSINPLVVEKKQKGTHRYIIGLPNTCRSWYYFCCG